MTEETAIRIAEAAEKCAQTTETIAVFAILMTVFVAAIYVAILLRMFK